MLTSLAMMPGGMMPSGAYGISLWPMLALFAGVGAFIVVIVVLLIRQGGGEAQPSKNSFHGESDSDEVHSSKGLKVSQNEGDIRLLSEVIKSLGPTLMNDERRVMDELVKARGEILQSDLPRMTDFSKATVSKAIHGLEVRGIVVREKHKWTYWCRLNPRLVERARQEAGLPKPA